MKSWHLGALVLFASTSAGLARIEDPIDPILVASDVELPGDEGAQPTRSVALQLTSDLNMDAVVLLGGVPMLVFGPGVYGNGTRIDGYGTATDVAALHRIAPGGLDALLLAQSSGIRAVWDGDGPPGYGDAMVLTDPAWRGVARLCTDDVDADGDDDLLALGSDRRTVLIASLVEPALPDPGPIDSAALFTSPRDVLDMTPVRWTGSATPQIALLTTLGVEVYDLAGTRLATFRDLVDGKAFARVRDAAKGFDRIAWVTRGTNGHLVLLTLDQTGYEIPLDLGPIDASTATAADWDGDGDDDLALHLSTSWDVLILDDVSSSPAQVIAGGARTFDPANAGTLAWSTATGGAAAAEHQSWPVFADFECDGDADLLVAVPGSQVVRWFRNPRIDFRAQRPVLSPFHGWHNGNGSWQLPTVPATVSFDVLDLENLPDGATALEFKVWRKPDLQGTLEIASLQRSLAPLDLAGTSLALYVDDPLYPIDNVFMTELRFVRIEDGRIVRAWPTLIDLVTGNLAGGPGGGEELIEPPDATGGGAIATVDPEWVPGGPPSYGGVESGSTVPTHPVSPFPPPDRPDPEGNTGGH